MRRAAHLGFVLLLLVLGQIAAVNAAPVSAADAGTPEVRGEVTLVGDGTAVARVRIPEGVSLDFRMQPDGQLRALDVQGRGRLVGFYLMQVAEPAAADWHLALRLPQPAGAIKVVQSSPGGCVICDVKPGEYLMYLVADGDPVTMTLRFGGLDGTLVLCEPEFCDTPDEEAMLHTLTPAQSIILTPNPTTDVSKDHLVALRSAADSAQLDRTGLLVNLGYGAATSGPPPTPSGQVAAVDHGLCIYDNVAPPTGVQPYCPGAVPRSGISIVTLGGRYGYVDAWVNNFATPGTYTLGAYQVAGGTAEVFGQAGLWLPRALP